MTFESLNKAKKNNNLNWAQYAWVKHQSSIKNKMFKMLNKYGKYAPGNV